MADTKTKSTKSSMPKPSKAQAGGERIAIIRLRGIEGVNGKIRDTMDMLRLPKKHTCTVYAKTPAIVGMAEKCKDYVTYGELDEETYKMLVEKRGISAENKTCHLNSPKGGFERKGIKVPFSMKGALGYRGTAINKLIKKMI